MEGSMMQYPPGDPRLVDKIVCQLKSQGIFDRFRKECISDVDTKPAYQNLHQRVEGTVSAFLANQEWRPELNKNQLRDSLRKHIHEAKILDLGVERIVDQVVNPKILPVFLPQIEDVVYNFLGIEKPKKKYSQTVASLQSAKNFKPLKMETLEDLLPKDLDPISPGSVGVNSDDENGLDDMKNEVKEEHDNEDEKMCDEEESSPPFEPIEKLHGHDDNSLDSHLSGISGLTSHDSQMSNLSFGREPARPHMEQNTPLKITTLDLSNQDSQLSKVSSGSRLSIVFSEDLDKSDQRTSPCTSDMDVQNDDSQNSKIDIPVEFESYSEAEPELKPEPEPEFEPEPDLDPDLDPETEIETDTLYVPVTVPVPPPLPISSLPIQINEESNCAYDSAILKEYPPEVPIKCPIDTVSERLPIEDQDQTSEIPCETKDTNEEGLEATKELDFDDREKQRERKEDRKQSSVSTDSRDSKRSESTSNSSDSERRKSDKDHSHRNKDSSKQEEKRRDSKDKLKLEDKSEKDKEDCMEQIEGQVYDEKLDNNFIEDKVMPQKPKSETNGELTKSGELTNENDVSDLKEKQKEKLKNDIKIEKDFTKEKVKNEEKELRDKTKSDEREKNKNEKGQSREASKDRSDKDIKRSHHEERAKEYSKEKTRVEDKSEKVEKEVVKEKSRHDEKSRDISKDKIKSSDKESSKEKQKIEEKGDKEYHKEKLKTEDKSKRDLSKDKTKHERSEKDGSRDSSRHRDQERGRSRSDGKEKRDDKSKRSENGDDEKRSKSQSDQKRDRERSSKESSRHSDKGKFDRGKGEDKSKEGKFENKESSSKHDSRSNDKSTSKDSKSKSRTESKEREEKRDSKKDERNKEKSKEEKGDRERGKDDRRDKDKTKEERSDKDKYKQDKEKAKDEKDKSKDRSSRSSHSSKDSDSSKKTDRDSSSKSRSSSEKSKDSRKKEKARPTHDDHSVHRDRRSDDRRSTDRDSNGAAHGQSANAHSSKRPERGGVDDGSSTSSKSEGGGSGGGGNGGGRSEATDACATGMEINEAREISLDEGVTQSLPFKKRPVVSSPEPSDGTPADEYDCVNNAAGKLVLKLKKPKIAANIFEVRKIMHLRKSMAKIERKKQRAEKLVNAPMESATDENSYDEQDLMFFTEEEARPESAFLQFIKDLEKSETLSELAASDEENMPEHSKAKRYEPAPSEALSSSTSTEETVKTPERTGVVSDTRPEVIHSSLAKQESSRGKASQAIPERKEKRRRDREVRREAPQRESRFRTTVASHDVNRTSPEAETATNPVMGNYLPSHISAVLGIDSGLNVNITKAPSPILEDVSPVESEIGNHAVTSVPNPPRSFTPSPAPRGRPPKRRAAPSPVFAADSSTTTPKRLRGDVQPIATNAISGIVSLEEPNKSADTRAVYSASSATNRPATLGMRKLHTTRSPSIINYGGYISKEIVEVKVLDADGDVDEYSTVVKENNNVDKSSSDDEKGCGEDMSLSKELISTALRDLMMESGLNLAESSAPPASTAREESEVVEEGSATSGPGRRVGFKAVRGRRLGLTRPTRRTASVDALPQTGSEFVLTPSSNNVAEPKEASATAGAAAAGSPRESATVGAGAFAGPSSRAGLAGGELPAPGRHQHR